MIISYCEFSNSPFKKASIPRKILMLEFQLFNNSPLARFRDPLVDLFIKTFITLIIDIWMQIYVYMLTSNTFANIVHLTSGIRLYVVKISLLPRQDGSVNT